MRQHLFRAKCLHTGEWVYGNFIHSKRFEGCANEFRIHDQDTGLETDVDPDTFCEFTGQTDKNGVKIFEGDILQYGKSTHLKVSCNDTLSSFVIYVWDFKYYFGESVYASECEVIGNTFDNPELLQ